MTKWMTVVAALVALALVSVHASPINDGATNKVMGRQDTAPSAEVVVNPPVAVAPAAPAAPAAAASEEDDDDDDDDDDDYGLDDLDDDDEEEEDEAEDDDDDDDDDYLDRFFDDILADDDDDDDDEKPKPPKPTAAPVVATPAPTPGVILEGAGNTAAEAEDDEEEYDDEEEEDNAVSGTSNDEDTREPEDEAEYDEAESEKDEAVSGEETESDDDEEYEEDDESSEDDDTDLFGAKRSRGLGAAKTPKMPAQHLVKYNRFVDTIVGRVNEVLKKSFDPVTVRLTRGTTAPPPSRRPSNPKSQADKSVEQNEQRARPNKNKQQSRQRAHATLIGLASLRRDGDVTVNSMSQHTTIRSRFLLGPLTLRVEKQFGRGAKKEVRSATATTDKMTGRLVLRVNQQGVANLHSIRVLQPKQVRVESDDDHDRTREFVWRRSSHIARLVSQKLTKAARTLLSSMQSKAGNEVSRQHRARA